MDTTKINESSKVEKSEKKYELDRATFRKEYREHKEKYPNFDQDIREANEFLRKSKVGKYVTWSTADFMTTSATFSLRYPENEPNTKRLIEGFIENITMFKYIKLKFNVESYDSLYIPKEKKYTVSINEIKTKGFRSKYSEITIGNKCNFRNKRKTTCLNFLVCQLIVLLNYFYSLYYQDISIEYNSEYNFSYKFVNNELYITLSVPHSNLCNCLTLAASSRIIQVPWYIRYTTINVVYYLI